jgi:energy-coupling factor transport system permease protein
MDSRVPVLYQDHDTILHRRDARVKILLFGLLFIYLFVAPTWQWLLLPTALGLVMAVVARTPWKWLAILWFLHIPTFIVLLGIPACQQLLAGSFEINKDIASGLRLTLAWTAAIFVSVSLFSTVDTNDLTEGLRALGAPTVAAVAVGLSYRLLYVTLSQIFQIADAMKIKGVNLETRNPIRLILNGLKLSMPILFTVVRRGLILMCSLEMRGVLKGKRQRRRSRLDLADIVLLSGAVVICSLALGARIGLLPSLSSMVGLRS